MTLTPPPKNPCPECPFNRNVKPGTLGGSPLTTYIGQISGPFLLTCHMQTDFNDPHWRESSSQTQIPQCAGATIMRANLGLNAIMPPALDRAEPDVKRVFANMKEFALHHDPLLSNPDATILTSPKVTQALVRYQMQKQSRGERP